MLFRLSVFVLTLLAGAGAGWWLGGEWGLSEGLAAGSVAWFLIDLMRGLRVVRWLRRADSSEHLVAHGLWGDVVDRARRALRLREQQAQDAQRQLQDFLGAIQASPNGVLLLDPQGGIEWCNQTAAGHLGIDPQRDLQQLIGNLVRDPEFAAY